MFFLSAVRLFVLKYTFVSSFSVFPSIFTPEFLFKVSTKKTKKTNISPVLLLRRYADVTCVVTVPCRYLCPVSRDSSLVVVFCAFMIVQGFMTV